MDNMPLEKEWLEQILAYHTKVHHQRALNLFKEYLDKPSISAEELIELKKAERNFETRVIMFYKWLQSEKKLSQNTARSYIIGLQSLFTYAGLPLRLKRKLPNLTMKLESYRPSVEDLQKIYAYGDLQIKTWLSLSRDCPARISDLLRISYDQIEQGEFLIKSEKENVVGKVYLSEETKELFRHCREANVELPRSQKGIDKLLERACRLAGIPQRLNQHLLRKVWISTAINLGLNETVIKVLSFKSVEPAMLTYFLERTELKESWLKVVNALPLKPQANGRVNNLMEAMDLVLDVLRKMCIRELESRRYATSITSLIKDMRKMTHKEILEEYLKIEEGE